MLSSRFLSQAPSILKTYGPSKDVELKINTDSRSFKSGETFVALHGDNFDGFNYVEQVISFGARAIVYSRKDGREIVVQTFTQNHPGILFIEATDSLKCIQELASLYIREWRAKKADRRIIGITGSNGKTTHKEMIYSLLNAIFPNQVLATKGNLNNHIGVPLTIFGLEDHHEIAIIEMGMNHKGEINELCAIAHPEHGIITNIGSAHIEFMHTMENIFKEKACLYQAVLVNAKGQGMFVVNADDEYLIHLEKSPGLTTYGEKNGDILIQMIDNKINFHINDQEVLITNNNILEHHNLKNLAGTSVLGMKLFPNKTQEIALAACDYQQPSMNRSQWIENIFLDAYNANPSSMRVSINSFVTVMKNKGVSLNDCYFVLGDMNELGVFAQELHLEIAEHVKSLGIKNVTFIGRYKDFYLKGFKDPKSSHLLKEEFHEEWKQIRKTYKFMFVKASRSLQLESLMSIV
ncbi:MAG: UDP-N-acetylmuramoyl-tripeptide--D-alanyl-D-alanine ligase [Bacteriovorax sp.]|nr:UDP-N-acetylmuramoyl-tripeptide--D-alanyl-D-alanine ligase [Bacteriovorax sp.]